MVVVYLVGVVVELRLCAFCHLFLLIFVEPVQYRESHCLIVDVERALLRRLETRVVYLDVVVGDYRQLH